MIFDGKVTVYSTCRHCDKIMQVVDDDRWHPNCPEKLTRAESLARGWLTAILADDDQSAELAEQEIERASHDAPQLHRAAMLYARWGWPVFPLGYRSKQPAIPKDKGGKGFLDATTDAERIDRWWSKHPSHNIGIATGGLFDVLDVDPPEGTYSFLKLLQDNVLDPIHGVSVTASGGMHLIMRTNSVGNASRVEGIDGLDWRGKGGYIVAPPSRLAKAGAGRDYSWLAVPSPKVMQ